MPNDTNTTKSQPPDNENRSNTLEKIFTAVSVLLIIALVGYLGVKSFDTAAPATFDLELGKPEKRGDFTATAVQVINLGDQAAKAVNIHGEIIEADGKPAEAEATLDWLPGRSRRQVTLIFAGDVTTTTPEVKVTGYEEP